MKRMAPIIVGIIALTVVGVTVWWFSPKVFLNNIEPNEIASIEVFNGNTGNGFTITEQENVSFIVDNIKSIPMKKENISMGMGTTYNLRFLNEKGNEVDKFIIMTPSVIRKGVVFYECNNDLKHVEDYLIDFERTLFPDTAWLIEQE